jgi:NAD(P)-dependent dehydrogenase (short-subunit alcohol dehydrogenase family)
MRRRGAGAIVNVTSVAGRIVGPASAAYAASKFATEALTEALAGELGVYGVRVALVEPGIIATPMTVENLPRPKSGTSYLQGGRMRAFYAPTAEAGPAPTVVAETIRDVIEGRSVQFRNPSGPDALPFLGLRASMSDEDWIGMIAEKDDEGFFARFQAVSGMDMRPPKGW